MKLAAPNRVFISKAKGELIDYFGRDRYSQFVVVVDEKHWLVKFKPREKAESKLDYLGYRLGQGWLNIPEVRLLSSDDEFELCKLIPDILPEQNEAWLVRLAQDYRPEELPIQNLTEAIAGELVYSLWIRRRDAHSFNRSLVDGIPMFFDFGAAFDTEVENFDLRKFTRSGEDPGYVGNWRALMLTEGESLNIRDLREAELNKPLTLHPIRNFKDFEDAVLEYVKRISSIEPEIWRQEIGALALNLQRTKKIDELLRASQLAIREGVETALELIRRSIP